MVAVKIKKHGVSDVENVRKYALEIAVRAYEDVYANQKAYVYLVSPANLRPDGWIYVSDTPMLEETVRRLKEEGRKISLGIKQEKESIEEVVQQISGVTQGETK